MSVNFVPNLSANQIDLACKPIANYSQYSTLTSTNPLAPLKQDCFVKSTASTDETENKPTDDIMIGTAYAYKSVGDLQSKLRAKERELEFNKKQLSKYPNNPEYGMKIDKLEKEIKELKREIAKAC